MALCVGLGLQVLSHVGSSMRYSAPQVGKVINTDGIAVAKNSRSRMLMTIGNLIRFHRSWCYSDFESSPYIFGAVTTIRNLYSLGIRCYPNHATRAWVHTRVPSKTNTCGTRVPRQSMQPL